jgi:hypothetical protein
MNRLLLPRVIFKDIIADEKRIETAYMRLFEAAAKNIAARKHLTNNLSQEYTKIQYGKKIPDNRGGCQNVKA